MNHSYTLCRRILVIFLCYSFALSTQGAPISSNSFFTQGGTISQNQTVCFGDLPDPIVETQAPNFPGPYQYMWMQLVPGNPSLNSWNVIPGATGPTYQPPFLADQTQFIRCVRPLGSTDQYLETNIITITIVPNAIANITYNVTNATQFDMLVFNSAFSNNSTYLWNFGNGTTCNTQNCTYSYNAPGIYTVTLTVTNQYGCVETSTFTITIHPSPLPVKLIYFEATDQKDGNVLLKWATESEIDNDYFEVEVSEDGSNFRPITTLEGKGTTNELVTYSYQDENPYFGFNYYRLKQVDFNGDFEYSDIASVRVTEGFDVFSVYPNPVTTNLNVKINMPTESGNGFIEIINMYGQIVKRIQPTGNSISTLDLTDIAQGTYLISYYQQNQRLYSTRFTKVD